MSIQLQHTGRRTGSTGKTRSAYRPMSEINVTPFVDVMLVLLIVFMVTAPLLTVGINVDLPRTKAPPLREQIEPLVVSIDKEGKIYVQKTQVELSDLAIKIKGVAEYNPDARVYLRVDKDVFYGQFAEVIALLKSEGISNLALPTKPAGQSAAGGEGAAR